jgi:hypothetical protein
MATLRELARTNPKKTQTAISGDFRKVFIKG